MNAKYSSYMNYVPVTNLETDIEKVSKDLDNAKAMLETLSGVEIVDYKSKLEELEESRKSKENDRLQVSMDLAAAGIETYLIEKEPTIGGRMSQLDKTFPTLDCSACILTPKMVDAAAHPNITIHTYSEVSAFFIFTI